MSHFQPYLMVLAVVDSFLLLMFVLDTIIGDNSMSKHAWFFTVIPLFTHPTKSIAITLSIVWIVIIAIERFKAISKPFKNNESIGPFILFSIIFSSIINLPR